jgi:mRNA interferase RelE/StbE
MNHKAVRILEIRFTRDAAKQLSKLHQPLKNRIREAILELPDGGITKLKGSPTKYKRRVGDYRIIFDMCDGIITIGDILPRGEAYKRL